MIKDDALTDDELIVLKEVLKDLTVRNKKDVNGLCGGLYEAQETKLLATYYKIEKLNKFFMKNFV